MLGTLICLYGKRSPSALLPANEGKGARYYARERERRTLAAVRRQWQVLIRFFQWPLSRSPCAAAQL